MAKLTNFRQDIVGLFLQPLSVLQRPVLNIAGVMNACEPVKNALVVDNRAILLKIRAERAILLKIQAVL